MVTLTQRLRAGTISDDEFDAIYPEWVRRVSGSHWTPIEVARRAAELLVIEPDTRVLDIGSGAGKFCLVGATVTPGTFFGVEQRASLVEVAQQAAAGCGISRVQFQHDNMMALDWTRFDAFYLFNPFSEHVVDYCVPIEDPIQISLTDYTQYVTATCLKLFSAKLGARVVTYYGYGGPMPLGYRRILREPAGTDFLELWEKESPACAR